MDNNYNTNGFEDEGAREQPKAPNAQGYEAYTQPQPQQQQQPQQQPQPPYDYSKGAYTCYSDGSHEYSNNNYYTPPCNPAYRISPPPKKRSKGSIALITVSAFLVVAVVLFVVAFVAKQGMDKTKDDNRDDEGIIFDDSEKEKEDKDQSQVVDITGKNESKELPAIIETAPVPENSYDSLVELYKQCSPGCVTIICTVETQYGFYVSEGQSLGSGFVVKGDYDDDGKDDYYIITNHHVIEGAKDVTVKFYDDSEYEATVVASDKITDIAVLTIDHEGELYALEMGDSDSLAVGQWVVAIGTPSDEELAGTMTYGIVSGVNRELDITNDYGNVVKTMTVIQITATINPGNSGGPLINMAGQVVGINAMKLSGNFENTGFALPSSSAVDIINSLIKYGDTSAVDNNIFAVGAAQLGISGTDVTEDVIEEYRLGDDCPKGVLVATVTPGSAVYSAGLNPYDIITAFNGEEIEDMEGLKAALKKCKAGAPVEMVYYRPSRRGGTGTYYTIKFNLDPVEG